MSHKALASVATFNIRHLSLRLLQVYVQVVRSGQISRAAQALHLTQPTVSQQIRKLTDIVGEPLLEPHAGQLQPTRTGDALFHAAQDVLARLQDFEAELAETRRGRRGHISLGVVNTAQYLLPTMLARFAADFPDVEVTLNIGNRAQVLARFARQQDDLYLFSHPPSGAEVRALPILRNPLCLLAPATHWAAQRSRLRFAELTGERFLLREPGSATRMAFETWLSANGHRLESSMQMESNEAIRLSVAAGLGLAVLSRHTLLEGSESLVTLPVPGFPLESHWYLVGHRDRRTAQTVRQFLVFLAAQLGRCVDPQWVVDDIALLAQRW